VTTALEGGNILHTVKIRKSNWIDDVLHRNCLLKLVIEGKIGRIEVTGRQGRRHMQRLDDLNGKTGHWKWTEEALDHTVRRTGCGRGFGEMALEEAMEVSKTDNRMNDNNCLMYVRPRNE
jgi:hypothetical protein